MASTTADCNRIMAAAKASHGILQIGHICRFNPRYRMAKHGLEQPASTGRDSEPEG
jgi:predicted dehydrogenase